ncbi:DUF255 domain-containing protein [soil metagenome]
MSETFRFSPNPNRAADIHWRAWGSDALDAAAAGGRPVLLSLTAVWCEWCQRMDETTYSDPGVIRFISEALLPVRVDTDRYPHVQDRYMSGGWPTTAFLTPTGEVLWSGTYVEAAQFMSVAGGVVGAWRDRRAELELEIGRRRRAVDAARGRAAASGMVRREAADDVLTAATDSFDARNGGFGDSPKFPIPELIELLYVHGRDLPECVNMADQTLDGMLAGELWDSTDGGFFRYAAAADWTAPRFDKLLEVNAGLLDAYSLGATVRLRPDWAEVASRTVDWVEGALAMDGFVAASQIASAGYFGADAATRATITPPAHDDTLYTSANARWIRALAAAGARLRQDSWVVRAERSLTRLLQEMQTPAGGAFHYRQRGSEPCLDFLLVDTLECARAALTLAQAAGSAAWLQTARSLARHMEARFWNAVGGFSDRARSDHDVGALRYPDRPFGLNAAVARLLLDLAHVSGERNWRALAERTLAGMAPLAGRHGTAGATFALATEEYFEPPPSVFIAVPAEIASRPDIVEAAAALRSAAFALPIPSLRVWTVPAGHAAGPQRFPAQNEPAAYLWTLRSCSGPIMAPQDLTLASAGVL